MGKFDNQLAHWREQHRIAVEDLEAFQSGERKIAEDVGEGWVDTTDRWKERVRNEVVVFAQLVPDVREAQHPNWFKLDPWGLGMEETVRTSLGLCDSDRGTQWGKHNARAALAGAIRGQRAA